MKTILSFACGLLFAIGLGLSGMTQPAIVKGFLNVTGQWDWRLMGVMIGAIGVHALTFRLIMKRTSPILDVRFHVPKIKIVNKKLIVGAALFGLGWGWAGICPGPGIVALASGKTPFVVFVLFMVLGIKLYQWLEPRLPQDLKD